MKIDKKNSSTKESSRKKGDEKVYSLFVG